MTYMLLLNCALKLVEEINLQNISDKETNHSMNEILNVTTK